MKYSGDLVGNVAIEYEDQPKRLSYDEVDNLEIDSIEVNIKYYETKEIYNSLKLLFTPMFATLMPKIKDVNKLKYDYFDSIDYEFEKQFKIGLYDLLNLDRSELTLIPIKITVLDFLYFLHAEFNQIMKPSDLLYSRYSKVFENLSKDILINIFSTFYGLVTI